MNFNIVLNEAINVEIQDLTPQHKDIDAAAFVLGHLNKSERAIIDKAAETACEAIELLIAEGPDAAMNKFNAR